MVFYTVSHLYISVNNMHQLLLFQMTHPFLQLTTVESPTVHLPARSCLAVVGGRGGQQRLSKVLGEAYFFMTQVDRLQ